MESLDIGSRREVCWDEALIEHAEGVEIKMHKPQYRGDALVCDKPWEGNVCCYFSLVHDTDNFIHVLYVLKPYQIGHFLKLVEVVPTAVRIHKIYILEEFNSESVRVIFRVKFQIAATSYKVTFSNNLRDFLVCFDHEPFVSKHI